MPRQNAARKLATSGDAVSKYQGDGRSTEQIASRIDSGLHQDVKVHCVQSKQTITEFLNRALANQLASEQRKSK